MFLFLKLFIFICGFSEKVTCAFFALIRSNDNVFEKIALFEAGKRRYLPQFDQIKVVQGFPCKSDFAIFARRVT